MNIKEIKNSVWEKLNDKIQAQKLEVKDKKYFVWKNIFSLATIFLLVLIVLFCFSFIFFFISRNNLFGVGHFGMRSWQTLFFAFPWFLLILAIILIFILESIFKKYQLVYRRPLVYSLAVLLICAFVFGTVIARTSWHDQLLEQAQTRHLPVLGKMYRNFDEPKNLHVGKLQERTEAIWTMQSRRGDLQFVLISTNTNFPQGNNFVVGDFLLVSGIKEEGKIEAWGIMPFEPRPFDRGFGAKYQMMK